MRKIIELDSGWQYSVSHGDSQSFADSSVAAGFPLCDSSPQAQHILRTSVKIPQEYTDGSVYLCFSDFWGDCELYIDKKLRCAGKSAGGNIYFDISEFVFAGEEAALTFIASPCCGYFAASGARLIFKNKSHFYPFNGTQCGMIIDSESASGGAHIHVRQRVINPLNYDIASFIVTDEKGCVLGSAASKPSQGSVDIDIPDSHFWNGPHDTEFLMLTASILRDSAVLDVVQQRFALRFPEIREDGFFCLNGRRIPISGMSVSLRQLEKVPVKRLMALADEQGANAFRVDASPNNLALIEECDKAGFALWLDLPSDIEGEVPASCMRQLSEHPSVIFVGIDGSGETVARENSGIITVNRRSSSYIAISDCSQAASLASDITKSTPAAVFAAENSTEAHEKIWAQLCSRAGLFAFFAEELFSCEEAAAPGLAGYEPTDAFYFYKSRFSSVPFVKIIPCEPQGKYADIKCCSNEASLSLTVNGKERKKYTATLTKGGLVIFGSVFLPSKENIVRVNGENSSDETEIIVTKRSK